MARSARDCGKSIDSKAEGNTFDVPKAGDSCTWQQLRSTNGTITKVGDGTLVLGNANGGGATNVSSGTGAILVERGTLAINTSFGSAVGSGPVTVNTNGVLAGVGLVGGPVLVKGTISPFAGGATTNALPSLTLANGLTLTDNSTYKWYLLEFSDDAVGVPGKDFSRITITNGNLTFGNSVKLSINFGGDPASDPDAGDPFWLANHTWTVVALSDTAANPASGNFATLQNASYAAGTFSTAVSGNGSITLIFTSNTAPPPAPRIETIANAGLTNVLLTWTSASNFNYQVQYNTNLATTNWSVLTSLTATGSLSSATDPAGAEAQRNYRVVLQLP